MDLLDNDLNDLSIMIDFYYIVMKSIEPINYFKNYVFEMHKKNYLIYKIFSINTDFIVIIFNNEKDKQNILNILSYHFSNYKYFYGHSYTYELFIDEINPKLEKLSLAERKIIKTSINAYDLPNGHRSIIEINNDVLKSLRSLNKFTRIMFFRKDYINDIINKLLVKYLKLYGNTLPQYNSQGIFIWFINMLISNIDKQTTLKNGLYDKKPSKAEERNAFIRDNIIRDIHNIFEKEIYSDNITFDKSISSSGNFLKCTSMHMHVCEFIFWDPSNYINSDMCFICAAQRNMLFKIHVNCENCNMNKKHNESVKYFLAHYEYDLLLDDVAINFMEIKFIPNDIKKYIISLMIKI